MFCCLFVLALHIFTSNYYLFRLNFDNLIFFLQCKMKFSVNYFQNYFVIKIDFLTLMLFFLIVFNIKKGY